MSIISVPMYATGNGIENARKRDVYQHVSNAVFRYIYIQVPKSMNIISVLSHVGVPVTEMVSWLNVRHVGRIYGERRGDRE